MPQPYFKVGDRKYRLRILNASNSRSYDLALSNGQSFIQIGTESGLLPAPVKRTHILIGPAERVDVVIDFAKRLNQKIVLQNLAATGSLRQLMQFRVTRDLTDNSSIPAKLRPLPGAGRDVGGHAHLRVRPGTDRRALDDQRPGLRPEPNRRAAQARHHRDVDPEEQERLDPRHPHPRRRPAAREPERRRSSAVTSS